MQSARETKALPPGHRTAGETAPGQTARGEITSGEATRGGLTRERGAYLLVIDLDRPLRLEVASLGGAVLAPGRYLYCGSAYGPGGLRARVGRHLRAGKTLRWHVDRLSEAGRVVGVGVLPGGTECGLRARLGRLPGVRVPVAGFGSTDCRRCPAHLLLAPEGQMSDFRYQMSEMAWFLIPDICPLTSGI